MDNITFYLYSFFGIITTAKKHTVRRTVCFSHSNKRVSLRRFPAEPPRSSALLMRRKEDP